MTDNQAHQGMSSDIVPVMLEAATYDHPVAGPIEMLETHISWVFLAGDWAYKIKKPIRNPFLDYSTLERRRHFCHQELQLNRQFAPDLYLDVVSINDQSTHHGDDSPRDDGPRVNGPRVNGRGPVLEYAVRMHRFAHDALLAHRLAAGLITPDQIKSLAQRVAKFHEHMPQVPATVNYGSPELILREALDNFDAFKSELFDTQTDTLSRLRQWTELYFDRHRSIFQARRDQGHVRQCHGDLHLGNIVWWHGQLIPFDCIEFSESFHWIDTLSDAGFTAMDLAHHGRWDYCYSFINAYLETCGDYAAVAVLRWYLVYRALVRAKIAAMRGAQTSQASGQHPAAEQDAIGCVRLAARLARLQPTNQPGEPAPTPQPPGLWITHGLSGSGKSFGSEQFAGQQGLIRIRADVERKRLAREPAITELYTSEMTARTYQRLTQLAEQVLMAGWGVIIDAACLFRWQRELFIGLAERLQVPCTILSFAAEPNILEARIARRLQTSDDVSDADIEVLHWQMAHQEPLTEAELRLTK